MSRASGLLRRAISHKATLDTYRKEFFENALLIDKKSNELQSLQGMSQTMDNAIEYLDTLIKDESGKFIKKLNQVLDYAVKTIFFDCNYSIDIRVSDNNQASIHLVYDDDEGNHLEPNIRDCGGGIRTLVGSVMQLVYIILYKVEPILFIDEGLSQLSEQYVGPFMGLIKEMAEKNGLRVLLITHDVRFLGYANRSYEVRDGKVYELEVGGEGIAQNRPES